MLTILNDPAGITGSRRFEWDLQRTMQENIAAHLDSGADCELWINGSKVDPLTDARLDAPPTVFDEALVTRRPAGFDPATWAYIIAAVFFVAAYTMVPKVPGVSTTHESPNNSLTAQTNIARAYQGIPDVYGLRRVWPDLIQPSTVEYVDNVKLITEWMCISRGKGTITAVKYAETPIGDIEGASYAIFEPSAAPDAYPENNATTLTNVVETFACADVNGQELPFSAAYPVITRFGTATGTTGSATFSLSFPDGPTFADLKAAAGTGNAQVGVNFPAAIDDVCSIDSYSVSSGTVTFTFTASTSVYTGALPDSAASCSIQLLGAPPSQTKGPFTLPVAADALRWNIVFLRGLSQAVQIKAEWWKVDGSGTEIGGTRENRTFSYTDATFDQRFFTTEVTPSAGNGSYKIEFTRTNAESVDGSDIAKLENLYAVRKYATKTLPGVTVIRITTRATLQATGIAERKFNLYWNRWVRTLTTDTLSASRNFARAMAHVWTLAGQDMAEMDTDALQAINTEFGETADILRFDGSLDDANMSLGERLQRIAYNARCAVWRDGTQWTVTREQAGSYPEVQLDYRNLASGGQSALSYSSHLPSSYDGVELEYVDETAQASKAYIRLDISSGSVVVGSSSNPLKIQMPYCTTQTQANNRARLEARRLLYQRDTVTDTALADGGQLGIGSLLRWVDPNDFAGDDGLQAGEVMSIAGSLITTSEALDWKGYSSGRMIFTGADGRRLGPPVVVTPSGASVQLASVPAGLYVAGGARQLGSRYSFGVGLSDAEMEAAGLYVATNVAPNGDGTVSLAFANYDSRLFADD